jgi:mRNA interferase MazF
MSLRRGDLVSVAAKGPYTGKPRPALIVQASESLPYRDSVTICLLTSELIEAPLFRVRVGPGRANGLWGKWGLSPAGWRRAPPARMIVRIGKDPPWRRSSPS